MSEGTDQAGRLPDAMASDLFGVDETSLDQLLAMSLRLARRLNFIGEGGHPEGDWSPLLERDESVLIARCQNLDLEGRAQRFLDDLSAARPDQLAARLADLRGWLVDWAETVATIVQPWSTHDPRRGKASDRRWALAISERAEALVAEFGAAPPADASLQDLRGAYFALSKALEQLQALTREAWDASLRSGVHEPAAAMLIAFCQMLGRVQARINLFTERLTDFYYGKVLHMAPRVALPDTVHLVLQRDPSYSPEVVVPAGAAFVARPAGGAPVEFLAESALTVTDARIEALCSLRLQRDALISPECAFGYVSRSKVDRFDSVAGPPSAGRPVVMPLLGADARSPMRKGEDARIGLAVSSPVLWLKEGERRIQVTLWFDFGGETTAELLTALGQARNKDDFCRLLGRLFARWVLPDTSSLTDEALQQIRSWAPEFFDTSTFRVRDGVVDDRGDGAFDEERYSATDPLVLLLAELEPGRADDRRRNLIRDELVENMFKLAVSKADGWHEIYRPVLIDASPGAGPGAHALTLAIELANEDPPVEPCSEAVHGADWPTEAPVLSLIVNEHAGIYPFSLMTGVVLRGLEIKVEVDGLRDVQAYNQLGPLDPSRPFAPFGPLPNTASYLVIGAPELARKYPTQVTLHLEWAALPAGGFAAYYEGYEGDWGDNAFTVAPSIMRDGLWGAAAGAPLPLFTGGERPVGRALVIDPSELRARWRPTSGEFDANQDPRNGLFKLQLASPPGAFGHVAYPTVLTEAVSAKPKLRKRRPMPNPPYTPLIERVTLSYSAATRLHLGDSGADKPADGERILHLRPFGVQEIYPAGAERDQELMPGFGRDGNLYIGFSAAQAQGVLTLLFDMRRDAAVDALARRTPRPKLEWSWLADDRWHRLDDRRILSDSTLGFLASGVVALDLPAGLTRNNRLMPGGLFWLRLGSDAPSGCFAGLKGVRAQALRAVRAPHAPPPDTPLPARSIGLKGVVIPGVIDLEQPEAGFGLRLAETTAQYRARVGERLRHKQRASTPWDYERLVLERFPNVYKVRCLANCEDRTGVRRPGRVLVAVAPTAPRNDARYSTRPLRLDPLELDEMERYLRSLASPAVHVRVRNASYELIQARCRVGLRPGADVGDVLRRVNTAIVQHLSPWHDPGLYAQFDWEVRSEEIEACIRRVADVVTVKGISMIHVWEDETAAGERAYRFEDTATATASATRVGHQHLWSLALPMDEHFIEVDVGDDAAAAERTGVTRGASIDGEAALAGIQIGRTFVVGGSR